MLRLSLVISSWLLFSVPSFAFFSELLQFAESAIQGHQKEVESGKKSVAELAASLDQDLATVKERAQTIARKILNSGLVTDKMKSTLLQALSTLEEELTRKIEDAKKSLEAKPDL